MTMYSINIDYTTGNSFGSERSFQEVGMNWENIDQAKKALARINEHYKAYKHSEETCRSRKTFDMKTVTGKPWFDGGGWSDHWKHTVVIEKDDGSPHTISAFWFGYFEKLHSAEVWVASDNEESNDMKIYF